MYLARYGTSLVMQGSLPDLVFVLGGLGMYGRSREMGRLGSESGIEQSDGEEVKGV